MAQTTTLARPYAQAAFEVALFSAALDLWSQALYFAATVAKDPRVVSLCANPLALPGQLVALHLPQGYTTDTAFARFLAELATHGRMRLVPEVAALFEHYRRESNSQILVKMRTAVTLEEAQIKLLKTALERRYQRNVKLELSTDPSLLGGVLMDTGMEIIDGSTRGRLKRLTHQLTH